ncbi:hypothetical protein CM15mP37_09860 [bacterium]|nr:MAG: hypothetical protein CM15mP37_09860 [bacterium]
MKLKTLIHNSILFALMFFLSSCSSGPSLDSIDFEKEFDNGKSLFLKKKYSRAQEKFNKVVIGALHTDIGDDALFYLAESLFLQKEYLLAIEEYDKLIRRMQFSPYIENARYRICESYVLLSPKYFHEQTFTEKALLKLQEYIDDYPDSSKRDEAQNAIISIRNKLSRKVYESGILYMKLEEYKAALLSFDRIIELYYDTDFHGFAHMQIIACHIHQKTLIRPMSITLKTKNL